MHKLKRILNAFKESKLKRTNENESGDAINEDAFQFDGFTENVVQTKYVDFLSDEELRELNGLLRWNCFTVDSKGRRFGRRAWPGKREKPQPVPDQRIVRLNELFQLRGKDVLEFGCFEGVHTVGLSMFAGRVVAVDSRIENVVKTIVRSALFGYSPTVFKCDLEKPGDFARLPQADVLHHVGVLYHLVDPVSHLLDLGRYVRQGIMLDTHFARPEKVDRAYVIRGRSVQYRHSDEGGKSEVFSGMGSHAKWLTLDTILSLLSETGFTAIDHVEEHEERNGPRLLLFARRPV
jgi:hypothetical protein